MYMADMSASYFYTIYVFQNKISRLPVICIVRDTFFLKALSFCLYYVIFFSLFLIPLFCLCFNNRHDQTCWFLSVHVTI